MYCTNCGKPIKQVDKYCAYCGNKTEQHEDSIQQIKSEQHISIGKKKSPVSAGNICLAILGLLLCLFGLVSMGGLIGALVWFFLILIPYIIFVIVYQSINNNK